MKAYGLWQYTLVFIHGLLYDFHRLVSKESHFKIL